jgi:para-aminobenzoate synthetase/4-amino-4-deoxychorismate lyase
MAFPPPASTVVAYQPSDVLSAMCAVETAVAAGRWAVGFVSYEAAPGFDPALSVRTPAEGQPLSDLPLVWFGLCEAPTEVEPLGASPQAASNVPAYSWDLDTTPDEYRWRVEAVRAHLAAGDVYQCNLTGRFRTTITGSVFDLYQDLAWAQRGAHHAYLDTGRFVVAGASPELFFEWSEDRLVTRPMKGTSARGRWLADDVARSSALTGSPKERAENVMIVDLLRNDVGKVAEWGSVAVPALFQPERYETLWQLTSTVIARTRPATTLTDIFMALFPCGSVTGAPKRRAMELIAKLEASPRGVYCGAVGVVAPPGTPYRARFNVAIRTAVVDRQTGDAVYGSGGGITWDSTAEGEHHEMVAKAAILSGPVPPFSLIETMGYWPGTGVRNEADHLRRLADSAEYFGFALDIDHVLRTLRRAVSEQDVPCRVRMVAAADGSVEVALGAIPAPLGRSVIVELDTDPVDSSDVWLFHKTTRRATYELRASRHPGVDDVVLTNERGEVTESTIANIAVRLDGTWWTPPVEAGCLPGVERGRLVRAGKLAERTLRVADLDMAEGLALVSSLRGWRPAELRRPIGVAIPLVPLP